MALKYQIGVDAGGTHSTAIAYDENGKEVNHINNTGIAIDDICPEWYAKRNDLKNRNKYINQDVYLLLDFIGKY